MDCDHDATFHNSTANIAHVVDLQSNLEQQVIFQQPEQRNDVDYHLERERKKMEFVIKNNNKPIRNEISTQKRDERKH